jgi:hypothetical protein
MRGDPRTHSPEQLAFGLGLKPTLRLAFGALDERDAERRAAEARGQRVATGADRRGRAILYVARDEATARALAETEARSMEASDASLDAHRELGRLLGYPACCVEAFVARLARGALAEGVAEDHVAVEDALARSRIVRAGLNATPLDFGPALVSHYVCRFDCPQSLAYAEAVHAELERRAPAVARAVRDRVSAPVAIEPDGRRRPLAEGSPDAVRLRFDEP